MAKSKRSQKRPKKHKELKPPKGYTTDEFGELKRKPSKLKVSPVSEMDKEQAEADIWQHLSNQAKQAIYEQEDQRVFEMLDAAMLSPELLALRDAFNLKLHDLLIGFEREVMRFLTTQLAEVSKPKPRKRRR